MRATVLFNSTTRPKVRSKSTAAYIFDPNRDHLYPFSVDAASFRARNRMSKCPVVSSGSAEDLDRIASEMIPTAGTIWELVLYFQDGASLRLASFDDAKSIYRRIVEHLDAHLNAMRTDITYSPPNVDDFRMLAEFATSIRHQAAAADPRLDEVSDTTFFATMPQRPTFSKDDLYGIVNDDSPKIPKSIEKMDAIERYLELIGFA